MSVTVVLLYYGLTVCHPFSTRRLKGYHRQLLIECERDVDEGMRRLEDDSDEADYVRNCFSCSTLECLQW